MRPTTPPTLPLPAPRAAQSGQPAPEAARVTLAFVGLALYTWVIHSYTLPIGTAAIGMGLAGLVLGGHRVRFPAPLVWFGLFVAWAAVTAPFSWDVSATMNGVETFAKLWLVFLVTCNVAHNRRTLYLLVVVWLGIYALYPVRGTVFNFLGGITHFGRYAWNFSFSNPNDLAAYTLPILAMSIMLLQGMQTARWIRWSALAGVLILPALIALTQSRGGLLALGTLGLLVLAQYRRQARGLAVAVLAVGIVIMAAPDATWDRLRGLTAGSGGVSNLREVDEEGSADQRFEIWRVATAIGMDHPVTGVGLGGYSVAHSRYARSGPFRDTARGMRDTHSVYLNALAETGFPGLFLLLATLVSALRGAWRAATRLAARDPIASRQLQTLAIGLVAFMQAGIFGTLHTVALPYLYLGVVATATLILAGDPLPAAVALRGARQVPGPAAAGKLTGRPAPEPAVALRQARVTTPRRGAR